MGGTCSPKFGKIFFSGNYHVKLGHFVNFYTQFSGKNVSPKVHRAATPMSVFSGLWYSFTSHRGVL